jgi:tagatose 6-phosphate kinase
MILCLGTTPAVQRSMRFDHLTIDGVNRTADVSQYASGKSINAARVLHTLGQPVCCTGFVGGATGEFLLADLDQAQIAHHFVRVGPATRLCTTLIDRDSHTATELIEESHAVLACAYDQLLTQFGELLPTVAGVLLSGSLPPAAPVDFYAKCVAAAVAAKKFVIVDAVGEPLTAALKFAPTVIKPNRQELARTVSAPVETDEQIKSAIRALLANGPRWAVVTDGPRDTVASDGNAFWKISTPPVQVISPIGSGDSFAAGLAAGIAQGQSVPQACQLAAACGSANALTDRAGHLEKTDVERLIRSVRITAF